MAKVIVFHFTDKGKLPKLNSAELNDIMNRLYKELKKHPNVKFNGTFVDENGRGICDWDAPDALVVSEIIKKVLGAPPADGTAVVNRVL